MATTIKPFHRRTGIAKPLNAELKTIVFNSAFNFLGRAVVE